MPNRSIRDEMQRAERARVTPSDPAKVRAALAATGNPPARSAEVPTTVVRADRPKVRGSSPTLTNFGGRQRRDTIDKIVDDAQ